MILPLFYAFRITRMCEIAAGGKHLYRGNPAAWAEPLSKVKDGLLSAFDTTVF
jgi:hypothetical protein